MWRGIERRGKRCGSPNSLAAVEHRSKFYRCDSVHGDQVSLRSSTKMKSRLATAADGNQREAVVLGGSGHSKHLRLGETALSFTLVWFFVDVIVSNGNSWSDGRSPCLSPA